MKLSQAKAALRKRLAEQKAKAFLGMLREAGLPAPTPEYVFHPYRKWRMDWAWPTQKVGLEMDGGTWGKGPRCPVCHQARSGRHTRGSGWQKDTEKLNAAACMGYRMLRVTPQQLCSRDTIMMLTSLLD